MRIKLCLFSALFLLSFPAFSQTLPRGVQQKASLGGITEYAYPNGLRVLLFPDPSSPKVTVNMTYLVGSRFEGYGETGMAHLLEHMNFILPTHDRSIKKDKMRSSGVPAIFAVSRWYICGVTGIDSGTSCV